MPLLITILLIAPSIALFVYNAPSSLAAIIFIGVVAIVFSGILLLNEWLDIGDRLLNAIGWTLSNIIAAVGIVPGVLAFIWRIWDLRAKRPIIIIEPLQDANLVYDKENFVPLKMRFFNPNPFTLFITEISICGKKQGRLAGSYQAYDSTTRELIDDDKKPRSFKFNLPIHPMLATGGKPIQTGTKDCPDMLFISKDMLVKGKNLIKFKIKYRKTFDKFFLRRTKVYSLPINHEVEPYPYENRAFLEKNHHEQ